MNLENIKLTDVDVFFMIYMYNDKLAEDNIR